MTRAQQVAIWESMADHFLDTDTDEWIPRTARLCVEAGLSTAEAGRIWRFEVVPAVWPNCWDLAGEWACWPTEWLVAAIERARGRWPNRPGLCGELVYRMRVHLFHESWRAIAREMQRINRAAGRPCCP
jgi:hypothetical protein